MSETPVIQSEPVHPPVDSPEGRILPLSEHGIRSSAIDESAARVIRRLQESGYVAYVAGGAVRDLLLGRRPKDFDVATSARPEEVRRLFRNSRMIGRRFRIVHVLYGRDFVEVSTFRSRVDTEEAETRDEGHTFRVRNGVVLRDNVYGSPLEDAWRRDFSVNALFYDPKDETILDYVGGIEDVRAGVLRVLGEPERRIAEDPVRMIRAVRFSAALGFSIEPVARAALSSCAGRLALASPARLYDEMQKLFFCGHAGRVLDLLLESRMLDVLFEDLTAWSREQPARLQWLHRVVRQVDIWRQARHEVAPGLFLALLCGPYHEALAAGPEGGTPDPEAIERAALDHIRRLSRRITVPRFIAFHVAKIVAVQPRFQTVPVRRLSRLLESAVFRDAYIYFKMSVRFSGRNAEALAWWEQTLGQGRGPESADREPAPGPQTPDPAGPGASAANGVSSEGEMS